MLSSLYLKLATAAVVLLALWGVHHKIWTDGYQAHEAEVQIAQIKANNEAQEKYARISQDYETMKAMRQKNAKTITKTVEKIITKDIYRNVCLEFSGMQLINSAIEGSTPSSVDAAVPKAE